MSAEEQHSRGAALPRLALPLFIVAALALKAATFGDVNRSADETFYFFVGQRMHDGLLPYVDVWDRKPLGLFVIYWAIAGLSRSVWAYQIVACLFAGATAFVVSRIVALWASQRAGLLGGFAYLATIVTLESATGQSPGFLQPARRLRRLARGDRIGSAGSWHGRLAEMDGDGTLRPRHHDQADDAVRIGVPGPLCLITPINLYSRGRVLTYARANCRNSGTVNLYYGLGWVPFVVFDDCTR